uniref:Uncharacterized protein n=1 Tax=Anguilla anguilla TaxID=7936 RepID=A0A0E9S141_ANGAN
MLQPLMYN